MPSKKKAPDTTETPIIAPVDTKTAKTTKGNSQVVEIIEVNDDEDTRTVITTPTKTTKGKSATKTPKAIEVAPIAQVETKAASKTKAALAPTKPQAKAAKAAKLPKEKLPKPVTLGRLELGAEVAKAVSQHMDITGVEAEAIVSEIINTMIDGLKEGNKVEIRGFGSFRLRSRRARVGRNPRTGVRVDVPSKTVVYFKMGKDLKDYLKEQPTTKIEYLLPEDFKVYTKNSGVVNWPAPGFKEVVLPTVNQYMGKDGGYVAFYTRNKNRGVYSVGGGIYVVGQIRLKGSYIGRIFHPHGYVNQDISASEEFKEIGKKVFDVDCWAGGDTGGWFGI